VVWHEKTTNKTKHVLLSGELNGQRGHIIKIGNKTIKAEQFLKYLGVRLDEKLNFRKHVDIQGIKL